VVGGDLAHSFVTAAFYVALGPLFILAILIRVMGFRWTFDWRRQPGQTFWRSRGRR
jgi:hypothetical protein